MPEQEKPIAILSLGIGAGILIYGANDDYIAYAWELNGERKNKRKSKVRYNREGNPYFISNNKRYYLNDFLKMNI